MRSVVNTFHVFYSMKNKEVNEMANEKISRHPNIKAIIYSFTLHKMIYGSFFFTLVHFKSGN